MKETLEFVEGRMDESEFYGSLFWNLIKGTFAVIGILILGLGTYHVLVPAATGGKAGFFILSWFVTLAAFFYVFRPQEWLGWTGRIMMSIYTAIYAFIMYIGGETVFIAMILLGVVVALVLVFGDAFFTGIFTYNDLKEWVKKEQEKIDRERAKADTGNTNN